MALSKAKCHQLFMRLSSASISTVKTTAFGIVMVKSQGKQFHNISLMGKFYNSKNELNMPNSSNEQT